MPPLTPTGPPPPVGEVRHLKVRNFIVATAGHVDHGKSALVKALTGTDPDRLPEEKKRGITIDLGFAHMDLASPLPDGSIFRVGIVDVPGHEDFVKNMVAGVGSIDVALLVVAADDGWMPQTEEHLQILSYLGVKQAVVALTKIDLVHDEQGAISTLRQKLAGTPFAEAPIVPTSMLNGRGVEDVKGALTSVLGNAAPPADIGKPRIPVDRVFTLAGTGTVITGTLTGGLLRRGDKVRIEPVGKTAHIRNIQSHNENVDIGGPGTRIALNLPSLAIAEDIRRGDVVAMGDFGGPSDSIDVQLEISSRAHRTMKNGSHVRVHHGSAAASAQALFFGEKELVIGATVFARLKLAEPLFVFAGDRFIVRDSAEQTTLAGGVVLDPDAQTKFSQDAAQLSFLDQRARSLKDVSVFVISQLQRDGAALRSRLLLKSQFSSTEIGKTVLQLKSTATIVVAGDFVIDPKKWAALRARAAEAIDGWHRAHPEDVGLPLTELRMVAGTDLMFPELFEPLVKSLCDSGFAQVGTAIRRTSHQPGLPAPLQAAAANIRALLKSKPFDPPSRKDLAGDALSQKALRFLLQTGEVTEINSELIMNTADAKRATELIVRFIGDRESATASEIRQALGTSRRVIIPFLEKLDREGVTVRKGDTRAVRESFRKSG